MRFFISSSYFCFYTMATNPVNCLDIYQLDLPQNSNLLITKNDLGLAWPLKTFSLSWIKCTWIFLAAWCFPQSHRQYFIKAHFDLPIIYIKLEAEMVTVGIGCSGNFSGLLFQKKLEGIKTHLDERRLLVLSALHWKKQNKTTLCSIYDIHYFLFHIVFVFLSH